MRGRASPMAQRCMVWVLAALLCQTAAEFESQTCSVKTQATVQPAAEAMLGGILAVQGSGADGYGCGVHKGTMQWYEALRFALGVVNKKDEHLNGQYLDDYYVPGVRLGMHVVDTCGNKDQGVAAVSSIFPSLYADARSCSQLQPNLTLGIVDSTTSGTARRVSVFSGQFNISVVSLASTAPELTTSHTYPNFLRTIPHDNELVTVMGQVLTQLKWHFVVVVYEDSHYGREAYSAIRPVLVEAGVCLSAAFTVVREGMSSASVRSLLAEVVATDTVGMIYLGGMTVIHALLEQGASVKGAGRLQWMVTDSLPQDSAFHYTYPNGILALVPASRYIKEFEDHWVKLDEENPSLENPWYRQWYMEKHRCNLVGVTVFSRPCSALYPNMTAQQIEDSKRQSFVQDLYVEPAVHAIFAYAHALRQAQLTLCPRTRGICSQLAALSHEDFLNDYLKKVDFTYAAQERVPSLASDQYAPYKAAKRLRFDARGDIVSPSFFVWNYNNLPTGEEGSPVFKFRKVGHFVDGRLSLNTDNIRMYAEDRVTPLVPLPASPCPARGCSPCVGVPEEMKYYFQDGDVVINGVFSLHRNGPTKFTCRDLLSNRHPLYLEAMIYAVKKVNSDASLLSGVSLGGLGIDDCMDSDLSTKFTEEVENGLYTVHDRSGNSLDPRKVEAYIGASSSPLTIPFAGMMEMFLRPVVGYHATSAVLDRYKYYLKTVPSVEDEFRAIIMIMTKKNWMHSQVLFSADAYSEDDIALFRRLAAKAGVCIVADYMFDSSNRNATNLLRLHSTVKPVVLLLSPENHRELLDVLNGTNNPNQFQFIATSTFSSDGYVTQGYEAQAEGFMSIDLTYSSLTQFYNDLSTHRVDTYQDNPWFKEWFESVFNCQVGGLPTPCDTSVGITSAPGFRKDLRVVHVINAVYAIARGLDSVLTRYCGRRYRRVCAQFLSASRANKGEDMVEEILKVTFPIEDSSPTQMFRFSNRGGAYTYKVYHFHAGQFTHVGTVTPSTHSLSQLTGEPDAISACPRPCTECLYMFAYQNYWYLDGDLIIPAVFDVHYKGSSMYDCGALRVNNGVQYTEAFKYALDWVNSAMSGINLRNVTLGGLAFDGCSSSDRALAIINGVLGGSFPIMDRQGERVAVSKMVSWLTYDSESTMGAGYMLKMMGMPLVSPGATAPQLLDKTRYSTFFRTVPSDSVVARAMATFIQDRGWQYVITVNDPDDGSRKTRDLFRQYLKDVGICVISSLEFDTDGSAAVILDSLQASTSQVVAVFADPHHHVGELLRSKEDSHPANDIVFIANRYWDLQLMGLNQEMSQLITNSLSFRLVDPRVSHFVEYVKGLSLADSDNPWLLEYYEALFRCDLGGSTMYGTACSTTPMKLGDSGHVYQHSFDLSTINAVYALAQGLAKVLEEKCGGPQYSGVCSRFLTDSDTLERLMTVMDDQVFTDMRSVMFVQRESNRGFQIIQHSTENSIAMIARVSVNGSLTYIKRSWDPSVYSGVRSDCAGECLECEQNVTNFRNFSVIPGDVYIVGLFDVHTEGSTPYTCGSLNEHQGLELLEAFNYAIDYINRKRELFDKKLRSVQIGGIGIDVCRSPSRAANLVANIHSGNIRLTLRGGLEIARRQILAYVGPFNTATTIRVADILSAIGVPQVTYGATGLALQDAEKYPYLLRSVPADDKQARAIISYLKNFNLTNIQLVTSQDSIGLSMTTEFKRLATLNLVCIKRNYTLDEPTITDSNDIVNEIVKYTQSEVVVLLVNDPLPILQAAGNNLRARDFLWIATDKWRYDTSFLDKLQPLLGDHISKKNVIIFDIETADVPPFDMYLQSKSPANYSRNPWFLDYYEWRFGCTVNDGVQKCDMTRGLSRREGYVQDPYILYVVSAVLSAGFGIDGALRDICGSSFDGVCPKFEVTGNRCDVVLSKMKEVNFTDNTLQPFYYEPTGESSRGYHIYKVTTSVFEKVGSFNDTHFLKLDITYDIPYNAWCQPYESCVCVNPFPEIFPSRYMLQPSPSELNLVYIGDIHQGSPSDPFTCSSISVVGDFYKMMAFFYAIDRVNGNLDNRYPKSLRLGGIALDTCSTTLRLEQDVFNLLGGFPLCDTGESGQVVPPSSIVAFVPDGNANSVSVSSILASTGITSVSPSATSPALRAYVNSEHFLSVVPPADVLANVVLKVMRKINWHHASVIYSDDPSMVDALKELQQLTAVDQTVSIGQAVSLLKDSNMSDAEAALELVSQRVGAQAVVLYTHPAHTRLLLQAAKNRGQTDRFVWLVTTPWGYDDKAISGLEGQASGSIIFQPHATVVEDFRNFVKSLTFNNRRGIPDDWFEEIYQTVHRCKIQDAKHSLPFSLLCSKTERISDDMVPYEPSVLHTVIAVYMVAQGLNQIPDCQGSSYDISACLARIQDRNSAIYQAIRTAQWTVLPALLGDQSFSFAFTDKGYGNIGFDILNYRRSPSGSGYTYSRLGRYTDRLDLGADVESSFRDIWGVAVATLAAIGMFVSLCLFLYLLVVYPVRGGTTVLGYILAFGIILLYGMVFAFVAHASVELCGLRRFSLGFCYALCYSALLVRLVECWRPAKNSVVFEGKGFKVGRHLASLVMTALMVLVQVVISAEWLIDEKPDVVLVFYNDQYWPRCTPDDFYDQGLVLSLCYIMVLILLTVLLGFCTFNRTKNHRESRWILGIAILAVPTWAVWCAWAVLGAVKTRDAAVAVGLLINATVLLLLGPVRKLWLLRKYQTLMEDQEEEEMNALQLEQISTASDQSDGHDEEVHQPRDGVSAMASTHGPYTALPSATQ